MEKNVLISILDTKYHWEKKRYCNNAFIMDFSFQDFILYNKNRVESYLWTPL